MEPEKQANGKQYSVKKKQNVYDLSGFSDLVEEDGDSQINLAVRYGRRSVIVKEIEKAKQNNNLDSLDSNGLAGLHHATVYNHLEAIENLLKSGAKVDIQSRDCGLTPLHTAARFGWHEALEILLKHGANASLPSKDGTTPLHFACRKGSIKIVELLIKQPSVDVNCKDTFFKTPLHVAAAQGHHVIVNTLLKNGVDVFATAEDHTTPLHGALVNDNIQDDSDYEDLICLPLFKKMCDIAIKENNRDLILLSHDMDGFALLHIIAASNNVKVMQMALDFGVDINIVNTKNNKTPLHVASEKGCLEMVEFLVERGSTVNAVDFVGQTPLHRAGELGHTDIMKILIDNGAEIDVYDRFRKTPFLLVTSCPNGKSTTVKLLLERGADITANDSKMKNCLHLAVGVDNYDMVEFLLGIDSAVANLYSPDVAEKVPLHYAAQDSSLQILKLLLTKQRRLNFQDEDQKTAIFLAAKADRAEHVEALGLAGASINDRDSEGMTTMHAAASIGNKRVCKILITLGADVNCKDRRERTPLMCAAYAACAKTVKALLNHNANIDDASLDGETALLCAVRRNNSNVVELLMDRNANVFHRDNTGAGVFETAVKYDAKDAAYAMCTHKRWKEVLNDTSGTPRPMHLLIKHFPEASTVIMNSCITHTSNISPKHQDYTITYDFALLDPGPDDPEFIAGNQYFGPETMVKSNRQDLLLHPLTDILLDWKWFSFGRYVHYLNLLLYTWFLVSYSFFVISERNAVTSRRNVTAITKLFEGDGDETYYVAVMLVFIVIFQLVKEFFQIILQGKSYFTQPDNLLEWVLYVGCLVFLTPYLAPDDFNEWVFSNSLRNHRYIWVPAIVTIILCYVNFVLLMRQFTIFGIYINMFLVVFRNLVKVMLVFIEFIIAFTVVFFIMFREQPSFFTFGRAMMKTIVMSVGEVDFSSTFIDTIDVNSKDGFPLNPFPELAFVICTFFVYAMCITLMNLLIGLAIGDIDNIQRGAEIQRLAMRVDFVTKIERKFPRFITRQLYYKKVEVKPNIKTFNKVLSRLQCFYRLFGQGTIRGQADTAVGQNPSSQESQTQENDIGDLTRTLVKNKRQIKVLTTAMEAQTRLLKSMEKQIGELHHRLGASSSLETEK